VTASGHHVVTGRASMPGRHAVRFNVGTGVKLSDSWDAYAGYSAELRDKATEHNVNVGVGYTF
jgi:outer membrane autotransporter protein